MDDPNTLWRELAVAVVVTAAVVTAEEEEEEEEEEEGEEEKEEAEEEEKVVVKEVAAAAEPPPPPPPTPPPSFPSTAATAFTLVFLLLPWLFPLLANFSAMYFFRFASIVGSITMPYFAKQSSNVALEYTGEQIPRILAIRWRLKCVRELL